MFHMRIHAFSASRVNYQQHLCEIEKKPELMFILRQGIPSHCGVRLIISIHKGFLPFPVGDGCSKIRRTVLHSLQLSGSNPGFFLEQTPRLCHQCNGCIRPDPRDDRTVFAKARVRH